MKGTLVPTCLSPEAVARALALRDLTDPREGPHAIQLVVDDIFVMDDGSTDNHSRPFNERRAPPILIWRYLTEKKAIPPSDIAVYCDLRFDRRNNPPPDDFVHFSGQISFGSEMQDETLADGTVELGMHVLTVGLDAGSAFIGVPSKPLQPAAITARGSGRRSIEEQVVRRPLPSAARTPRTIQTGSTRIISPGAPAG